MPRVKFDGLGLEMDVVRKIDAQLKRLPSRSAAVRTLGMVLSFVNDATWAVALPTTEKLTAEERTLALPLGATPEADSDPFGD